MLWTGSHNGPTLQICREGRVPRTLTRFLIGAAVGAGMLAHAQVAVGASPSYSVHSFTAQAYGGVSPADVSIAAGQRYLAETINTSLTVYTKSGVQTNHRDFGTLFAPATSVFCADPVVVYSDSTNRYALVCTDTSNNTTRLAVSETGDPNGAWHTWNTGPGTAVDQPSVEITRNKLIVVGSNAAGAALWVYQLSDILSGSPTPRVKTLEVPRGQYRGVTQASVVGRGYLLQAYPGHDVFVGEVQGTPATQNVSFREIDLGADTFAPPHDPSIPGGKLGGGFLDGRVLNASYETTATGAKIIQFSQMASCGGLDCSVYGRLSFATNGPRLAYLKSLSSTAHDQTYAAIAVDRRGRWFEAYTRSSPTQAPQAAIQTTGFNRVVRNATPGTTACHTGATPPCDERWGDYLGAAPDPTNDTKVWLAGLYQTASGDDGWTTVITSVTVQ